MSKSKGTKRSLLASLTSLLLCVAMLIGSTFAWFTDTASTAVNKIQAGNLDVALEMKDGENWVNAEGQTLQFKKASTENGTEVLWEPGCTYELPELRIVNNGNLALKYKIIITGIKGSAKLNEAIEWTMKIDGVSETLGTEHKLAANANGVDAAATYDIFTISGHMKEDAGNEYQGLSIDGISITVYATQVEGEYDSNGMTYDSGAVYNYKSATIMSETDGKTYTLESGHSYTVGAATVEVAENGDITYTNTGATTGQTVTITTSGGKLTVNAPKDTIHHYGESEFVDVKQTASESFHEFGKVAVLAVASGRVVIENGNNVAVLQVVKKAESSQSGAEAAAPVIAVPQNEVLETKIERADDVETITIVTIDKAASAEGATDTVLETTTISFSDDTASVEVKETGETGAEAKTVTAVPTALTKILEVSGSAESAAVAVKSDAAIEKAKDYVARIGTKYYETLDAALTAANKDTATVELLSDIKVDNTGKSLQPNTAVVKVPANVTLDGRSHTITAGEDWSKVEQNHILGVGDRSTIKNLTIVGNACTKHGINVYAASATLSNVEIKNCGTAAIVCNGDSNTTTNYLTTISGLRTSGNAWGAVNVDKGANLTIDSIANLSENGQIWTEAPDICTITITDNNFKKVTGIGASLKGYTYYSTDLSRLGAGVVNVTYPYGVTAASFPESVETKTSTGKTTTAPATAAYVDDQGEVQYVADVTDAITAGATTIYLKENDSVRVDAPATTTNSTNRTSDLTSDLTIYANGADFQDGQISMNMTAAGKAANITVKIVDAKNVNVWGSSPNDGVTQTVILENCHNEGTSATDSSARMFYLTGTTGTVNVTLRNCSVTKAEAPVYMNCNGSVTVENCSFSECASAMKLSLKATSGTTAVAVSDTTFDKCGWTEYDANKTYLTEDSSSIKIKTKSVDGATLTLSNVAITNVIGSNSIVVDGEANYTGVTTVNATNVTVNGTAWTK